VQYVTAEYGTSRWPPAQQQQQHHPWQQQQHIAWSGGALTHAISSSSSWQELQHLLLSQQQELGPVHVAAALSRLAKVAPPINTPPNFDSVFPRQQQQDDTAAVEGFIAGGLLPLLRRTARVMNPRALANSTWALAKLGFVLNRQDMVQVRG
jgi:hypothetical protein